MAKASSLGVYAVAFLVLLGYSSARSIVEIVEAPKATSKAALAEVIRAQRVERTTDCDTCMLAVHVLEDALCDPASTSFVINFIESRICPALGDSPKCHNLAQGLIPVIVQWLRASSTPGQLCADVGMCDKQVLLGAEVARQAALQAPALRLRDTAECGMCKFAVSRVQVLLNDTSVQQKLNETAQAVCAALPAELSASCTSFVNTYEPLLAQFITTVPAGELCELLGVCMESLMQRAGPLPLPAPLMKQQQQQVSGGVSGSGSGLLVAVHRAQAAAAAAAGGASNDACDMCKMAVIEAHSLLVNPSVQQDLINYTKAMCDTFPSFSDACKLFVDQYSQLVISVLQKYLDSGELCAEIGLCTSLPAMPLTAASASATASTAASARATSASASLVSSLLGRVREVAGAQAEAHAILAAKYSRVGVLEEEEEQQ